jgi:hypothetical protein
MNKSYLILTGLASIALLVLVLFLFYNGSNSSNLDIQDINGDGIWDDVEPFIKIHSKTKYHQKALEQFFKVFQKDLTDPERCIQIKKRLIPDDSEKAIECLNRVDEKYGGQPEISDIEDAIVNTIPRARAYNKYNSNCSGGIFGSWDEAKQGPPCEFDLE